jgi:putative heme-binding domain-containing protein
MTSRVNQNTLKRTGSSVRAIEQPDLVSSSDPWFRPVDLVAGPDGALYVADFYNRIIGHYEVDLKHPGRDRFRGRLWRVRYAGTEGAANAYKGYGQDLTALTTEQLLEVIRTAPEMQKRLARDVIADDLSAETTATLKKHLHDNDSVVRRFALRLLALRDASVIEAISAGASDDDELVRVHAFRALREVTLQEADQTAASQLLKKGFGDLSAMVRRSAVAASSRQQSQELIAPLLRMFHTTDLADVHLRHSIRIALRDHLLHEDWFRTVAADVKVGMDRMVLADLSLAVKTPAAAEFVAGNIQFLGVSQPTRLAEYLQFAAAHVSPEAAEGVVVAVRERFSGDRELQRGLLNSMRQGFAQRGQQPPAAVRAWAMDVAMQLLNMKTPEDLSALDVVPAVSWNYQPHSDASDNNNCWGVARSRMSADGVAGAALYSSFEQGERRTGIYRSAPIEVGDSLSFYIAGHDGIPDAPLKKANFVRLRDAASEELLREASPLRNDVAQKVEWKTDDLRGRKVVVELVDGDSASAYAWIAVGRFSDDRLNPSDDQQRQLAAAELIGDFGLQELRPAIVRLSTVTGVSRTSLVAMANSLLKLRPNSLLTAVSIVPTIAAASDTLAQSAMNAIVQENSEEARKALEAAFQVSTAAEQLLIAQPLAADLSGAEELLRLMEAGKASARLLLKPAIQQRLNAIATEELKSRVVVLTEKLPTEDSIVEELLTNRRKAIQQTAGDIQNGKELFKKNCQICHQIAGEGKQVGPNLDGIGNRGLDRVLEDVLIPNRNVDVAFRTTTVVTDEGKAYSGLLKELEGNRISIVDSQAKETILQTDIIEERKASANSPMPSNVGETLNEVQLRDLVSFLLLQKKIVEGAKP